MSYLYFQLTYPFAILAALVAASAASADPFEVVEVAPGAIGLSFDPEDGSTVDRDATVDERHGLAKRSPKILGETAIFKKLAKKKLLFKPVAKLGVFGAVGLSGGGLGGLGGGAAGFVGQQVLRGIRNPFGRRKKRSPAIGALHM